MPLLQSLKSALVVVLYFFLASAPLALLALFTVYRIYFTLLPATTSETNPLPPLHQQYDLLAVIAVFIIYEVCAAFIFPVHLRGGWRSYRMCRGSFLRTALTQHFRTQVHFDTDVTRANIRKGGKEMLYRRSLGDEEIEAAKKLFPRTTLTTRNDRTHDEKGNSGAARYVLSIAPHGFLSMSVWGTFLNSIADELDRVLFRRGFSVCCCTMDANFYLPLWREFCALSGLVSVSRKGISAVFKPKNAIVAPDEFLDAEVLLARKTEDNKKAAPVPVVCCLVPGGSDEALHCTEMRVRQKRTGFVRVALEEGADLVPVINFGELNLYDCAVSWLGSAPAVVRFIHRVTSVAMPVVTGRWGLPLLPKKVKLDTVIGRPIHCREIVEKLRQHQHQHSHSKSTQSQFTKEEIAAVHSEYLKALRELYDRYAPVFGETRELIIE